MASTLDIILRRDDNTSKAGKAQPSPPVATTTDNTGGKGTGQQNAGAVQPASNTVAGNSNGTVTEEEFDKVASGQGRGMNGAVGTKNYLDYLLTPSQTVTQQDKAQAVDKDGKMLPIDGASTFTEDQVGAMNGAGTQKGTASPVTGTTGVNPSMWEDDEEMKAWQAKQDAARADIIAALERESESIKPAETPDERKKREKRERMSRVFSAIGDGISALSNLYFTTQGAPNMYTGETTLSGKNQERIERMRKEREADRDRWLKIQTQRYGLLDDAIKQRRTARKEQMTLMLQAQKAGNEAKVHEARARALEQQGNHYAAQVELEQAKVKTQEAETAKKQAEANEAESNARFADSKNQSIVTKNNAAAGASDASRQNSLASAGEHNARAQQIRTGKDSSVKGTLEGVEYYNDNDYKAAVRRRAGELGINPRVQYPTGEIDDFDRPKYNTRAKSIDELAGEIERRNNPGGNGRRGGRHSSFSVKGRKGK